MGLRIVRVELDDFAERRNSLGPPFGVEVLLAARNSARSLRLRSASDPWTVPAGAPARASWAPQQCLSFRPLPHGQASLRPTFALVVAEAPVVLIPPSSFLLIA
jgi:hypothetical protein